MIREDELVTARVISTSPGHSIGLANSIKPTPQLRTYPSAWQYVAEPEEPSRMRIRIISAELARRHASALRNGARAIDGILAFEGEFIDGNTSLVTIQSQCFVVIPALIPFSPQNTLRREVARVFGWISEEDAMITDDDGDNQCDHQSEIGIACSCALALEIEQYGLFSTLHCRFALDQEHCSNPECPYSHSRLECVLQNRRMTSLSKPLV
jgi:hypothetical protein